jgi:hypothetical protein
MKKYFMQKKLSIACLLIMGMLTGCSKEVDLKTAPASSENNQVLQSPGSITDASIREFLTAPFIAQVNTTTRTDSSTLIFDFVLRKQFQKGDNDHVLVPYGDPQFADRGWKYETTVDPATKEILLSPNDVMEAGIVPGSFQTALATFDPSSQIFNFITRFKELNGNRNEVGETLWRR